MLTGNDSETEEAGCLPFCAPVADDGLPAHALTQSSPPPEHLCSKNVITLVNPIYPVRNTLVGRIQKHERISE